MSEMVERNWWVALGSSFRPAVYIHTPWAHIVIGLWRDRLFSERYGYTWCRRIGPLRLTIRKPAALGTDEGGGKSG